MNDPMLTQVEQLSPQEKRELLAQLLRAKTAQAASAYPLSYAQQALWFISQSDPESAAYNVAFTARIHSALDVAAFQRSFQALIKRHAVLCTTFKSLDGKPVQEVRPSQEVCFEQHDASAWTWDELMRQAARAYQQPFDLEQGPLFRVHLFTRSDRDHVLLLVVHHIIVDAWSMWVLLDEFQTVYASEKAGRQVALPLLKLAYTDYVQQQADMLASPQGERLWTYWRQQLSGELPALNLPTDHPRPPVQTYNGASYPFTLSAELTQQLRKLAQAEGVTLYMLLLAAFQVLLHRYTSQDELLVGSPTTGRNQAELAGMIGYFVNMVVLRANFSDNPPFTEFLKQVRQTVLAALEYQEYPFPLLVEKLRQARDPSRSPIFQTAFALQKPQQFEFTLKESSAGVMPDDSGGFKVEPFEIAQQEGQFDLALEIVEERDVLPGVFKYNTDLFDHATITRMMGHFQTLLAGITVNPRQGISALPLLNETERLQILVEWNDTQADYPQDKCLQDLFAAQVERTPNAVALSFADQQFTYRELNARANQLAHYLQALGVGPEVLVGICVERSLDMVVGLMGILKAGGVYVPLDPLYPPERLSFMLEDARALVVLTQHNLVEKVPAVNARVICLDSDWGRISQERQENSVNGVKPENLAYVIYTSGSTGKPKGVQISQRALVNFLTSLCHDPGITAQDMLLAVTTISFDIAGLELYLPLIVGGQVVLASQEEASDGRKLFEKLRSSKATMMQATPVSWRLLLAAGWEGDPPLKILCGGEALPRDLAHQLIARSHAVWNMYGPTETTIWSTLNKVEPDEHILSIGRPIANTQIYILDSHLQPVPIGVAGELYIGGDGLSRGYFNRPELTAEKFIPLPFSDKPGERLYKTGDLARYFPDGTIECLGRIDHQVKIRGFRIELGEIETCLLQHIEVKEAVVIAREDAPGDKRLVAYLVPNGLQAPAANELRNFLKERLPDYMIPSAFVILEAFPLTPNGKIDRRALPAPDASRSDLEKGYVAPQTPTEKTVADLWAEVLKLEQVGIHDNFFELGGHSLLATQLISRISNTFQIELPLHDLFAEPTVARLAQLIDTLQWAAQGPRMAESTVASGQEEGEI